MDSYIDLKSAIDAVVASAELVELAVKGYDDLTDITPAATEKLKTAFLATQAALQAGFPALKAVRKEVFRLQPQLQDPRLQ